MAGIHGSNQSPLITQRYLNTASYAGDPTPGAVVSTSQVSGSIVQPYGGQTAGILTLSEGGANYYTDPTNGQQLYAGDYQYVQFLATSVNTAVQGQPVFWAGTELNGLTQVTPDFAPGNYGGGLVAGIALANTAKGNYWWIQIAGIAQVLFAASVGVTTPSVGDLIYVDYTTPSARGNVPGTPSSTTPTNAQLKFLLGRAWGKNPAASAVSPVVLGGLFGYYPGGGSGAQS